MNYQRGIFIKCGLTYAASSMERMFFFAETGGVGMNLCPSAALIDDAKTLG